MGPDRAKVLSTNMAKVPGGISVLASIGSLYVRNTGDPTKGYEKLLVGRAPTLTHRIPPHLDAMGGVLEPVEDTVGQRRITYPFVPPRNRQLQG
jgi:hypothetical protein